MQLDPLTADPTRLESMRVVQATWEAEGVLSLRLELASRRPVPPWEPGAHLDLVLPSGLVRQYSLCGDVQDPAHYRIAVRLDEEGRGGSKEVHHTQLVGRNLMVRGPRNHFALVESSSYAFIAGGIGITPLLPMMRRVAERGQEWRLIYGGRSLASMPFVAEIDSLSGHSVELVPEDTAGFPDLESFISRLPTGVAVYACGPEGMLQAVAGACRQHLPEGSLHIERFAAPADAPPQVEAGSNSAFEVELHRTGEALLIPPDRSILSVVLEVKPDALYSCEEGFCGACETPVLDGIPDHRDSVLTPEERERSASMMICVSRSHSPRLVLDA